MGQILEVIVQTLLAFFSIMFMTRILGRQQVAQLTVTEYINGITFGSIAATLATDLNQRTWQHLIGLIIFASLTFIMSIISLKSRKLSKMLQGEPVLVIENGKILEKNLHKFHYNIDDLTHILRKKDIFDIKSIKFGILETTGEISIIKVADKENVTIGDLKLKENQKEIQKEVIISGNIIYENLKNNNLSAKWLFGELEKNGIVDIADVYYAAIDSKNNLYIDKKDDEFETKYDVTERE